MTHTPHDLLSEFPNNISTLHRLKLSNAHFNQRADIYHNLNREIHRIEAEIEPSSGRRLEGLKKQRLALLDEFMTLLASENEKKPA